MTNQRPLPSCPYVTGELKNELFGTVTFRNWTLGEHQATLFNKGSENEKPNVSAILKTTLKNCVLSYKDSEGRDADIENMPLTLAEWCFIKIREISVSDTQDFLFPCTNCLKESEEEDINKAPKVRVTADLKETSLSVPEQFKPVLESGMFKIKVKLPSLAFLTHSAKDMDASKLDFLAREIEYITDGEELWHFDDYSSEERINFVRSLPPTFIARFVNNYKYLPRVETPINGCCEKCGHEIDDKLIGISKLFTG